MLRPNVRLALFSLLFCLPLTASAENAPAPNAVSSTPSALSPTTEGAACVVPPHYSVLLTGTGTIAAEGGPGGEIVYLPSGPALLSGGIGVLSLPYGLGVGVGAYSLSS